MRLSTSLENSSVPGINRGLLYFLTLLPPVIVLVLYGYIGAFNRLLGDSLCSFYHADRLGLFRSLWYWRITWSGRYSSYGFDWLTMKILGAKYIPLLIPLMLVLWIAINIVATHLLIGFNSNSRDRIYSPIILGPILVFLVLAMIPNFQQSLLWVDGFRAYTLPIMLLGVYLILYFLLIDKIRTKPKLVLASVAAFLLFFGNGGFSETFAAFQFTLLAYWIVYYWFLERPHKMDRNLWLLVSGWIGASLALVVIITAPGNAVRQVFFPPPPRFFDLMRISLVGYLEFLAQIFSAPEKLTALLGAIAISAWAGSTYEGQVRQHTNKILLQLWGAFLLSFACFPPGVYGYSEPPPSRVFIIPAFILGALLMSASFVTGNLWKQKSATHAGREKILLFIAIGFLVFSGWKNAEILYGSRSIYISYAQRWDAVDAMIKEAKAEGKQTIEIPRLYNWAQVDEPNDNPKHWANECYSGFYGIQVFGSP